MIGNPLTYHLWIFPHPTPCARLSPHTALPRIFVFFAIAANLHSFYVCQYSGLSGSHTVSINLFQFGVMQAVISFNLLDRVRVRFVNQPMDILVNYCKYYEVVYILFNTGMRISEFCGLTMKDIDFENHLINVDHQLIRTPDMVLHVQETKTSAGKRKLPMTKEVEDCFRAIVDDRNAEKPVAEGDVVQMEKAVDGYRGFLFLDDAGLPLVAMHWEHRFNNMVNRYNAIYKEQMPNITPHVCRHTYCSNMAKAGMNPKTLQYLMGHSDITVTLDTYTHLGLEDAAEELKRLAEVEQARKEQEKLNQNRDEDEAGTIVAI